MINEKDARLQNDNIKNIVDEIMMVLIQTKENLHKVDEFETTFNLLMCKNHLSKLLFEITSS